MKKQHRTAKTSIEANTIQIKTGKKRTNKQIVIAALKKNPVSNNRQLSEITGIEIGTVSSITSWLKAKEQLTISTGYCPSTGYKTQFLKLKN